ncbi:MAG: hypothetical protein L0J69_07725, partial [Yaniella sp.]|nr:hypothetical protein [Yaniella sp.]
IIAAVELQTDDGATSEASNALRPGPDSGAPAFDTRTFDIANEIIDSIHNVLGGLAAPRTILFVDKLPNNARTVLGNMTSDQLPSQAHASYLTWNELVERATK